MRLSTQQNTRITSYTEEGKSNSAINILTRKYQQWSSQGCVQQFTGRIGQTIGMGCDTLRVYHLPAIAAILFYWIRMKVVQQLTCLTQAVPMLRGIRPVSCWSCPRTTLSNKIKSVLTRSAKWSTWLFGFDVTAAGLLCLCRTAALVVPAPDALDRLALGFNSITIKCHAQTLNISAASLTGLCIIVSWSAKYKVFSQ